MTKYHARKVKEDGYTFDSMSEHKRYRELKLLQTSGQIHSLVIHPKFPIFVQGHKICTVILDFEYIETITKLPVHEDVKGFDPPMSKLKRKLLLALYPTVDLRILKAK